MGADFVAFQKIYPRHPGSKGMGFLEMGGRVNPQWSGCQDCLND